MATRLTYLVLFCTLLSINIFGCGGSMKSFDAFDRLEPIGDLPEPTGDHNLVVQINNVADNGTSFKNWAELFINDQRIHLNKKTIGLQQDYRFHFKLKSGVYKIKAVYHAEEQGGGKKFEISTEDKRVRIYPDRRTVLRIDLDKKLDGRLKSKKNFFEEMTEPFTSNGSAMKLRNSQKNLGQTRLNDESPVLATNRATVSSRRTLPPRDNQTSRAITPSNRSVNNSRQNRTSVTRNGNTEVHPIRFTNDSSPRSNSSHDRIMLQINSTPSGADVLVDGKFVGNSPVNIELDRNRNHVVQLSRNGYVRTTKVLTVHDFANKNRLALSERLKRRR